MLQLQLLPFPELETERLLLRRVSMEDVSNLFILRSDPRVMEYVKKEYPKSADEMVELVERINNSIANNEGINWAVNIKNSDAMIGIISFWRIDKAHHRGEIGYMLMHEHMRKGFMNEAIKEVLNYGFNVMKLHSVEANIDPLNEASKQILLKFGFRKEAYFRENYFFNGEFFDSEVYSLLVSDYRAG